MISTYLNNCIITNYENIIVNSSLTVVVYRAADELQKEAKAHVLNHVNVVTLYAMIFEPKHYGVVMEFVPHGCLEDYVHKNKVRFLS